MVPATEYHGLIHKNGACILSDRARQHPALYHSLLRIAYHTWHLIGCFGARLSFGKCQLPGMTDVFCGIGPSPTLMRR
eukprot:7252575-Prorocentrum_lima.AAC.1